MRKFELELPTDIEPRVARLRTSQFKKYREWRDAALFTYGIGLATDRDVGYATVEAEDYDFVTAWVYQGEQFFAAVQLKELPPADISPSASLKGLLEGIARLSQPTTTILAIRLNRAEHIDFDQIVLPPVGFAQVWLFGAASPDASHWLLVGDLKARAARFDFRYPA